MTRKILVQLDGAASPGGIVGRNKITSVPRAKSVIVVAKCANSARTGATTGSLSGRSIFLVGHVCTVTFETREVDASPVACDQEGAAALITLEVTCPARSAQIKHAVRVHQGSLIL